MQRLLRPVVIHESGPKSHKIDWEPPEEPEEEPLGPPPIADLLGDPTIGYPPPAGGGAGGAAGHPNAPPAMTNPNLAFPPGPPAGGQWPSQQSAYPPSQYGGSTVSSATDHTAGMVDAQWHPLPGTYPTKTSGAAPPPASVGAPGGGSSSQPPPYQQDNGRPPARCVLWVFCVFLLLWTVVRAFANACVLGR